jgi:hypothetical protein
MLQRSFAVVVALILAGASAAWAQSAQAPPAGRRGTPPDAEAGDLANLRATGELIGMLEAYAIVQAQQTLQLGDEQYGQFIPRLKRLQATRRRSQQLRNRMIAELRRLAGLRVAAPADDDVLRERLKALRDHDERAAADLRTAYAAIDEILDLRQQARFRIFEEHIENRKLDLLLRARARAGQRGTPRQQ